MDARSGTTLPALPPPQRRYRQSPYPDAAALLRRAVSGEPDAWNDLVRRHASLLMWAAAEFHLTIDDVADSMQMTWLRLLENVHRIREPERLPGWLVSTMRHECLRVLRRRRHEHLVDDWTGHTFVDAGGPDVDVLLAERDRLIWSAVDDLPDRQRELLLALFEGPVRSYAEVSSVLSVAVGSIGPTRARALERLRGLLEEVGVIEAGSVRRSRSRISSPARSPF